MEVLAILFGLIFWPTAAIFWTVFCIRTKRSKTTLSLGCLPLILLPLVAALAMGHYMFVDEPLYMAIKSGETKEVERLLNEGADPNVDFNGTPAIVAAASGGNTEIVRMLIRHGVRLDKRNSWDGNTALMAASFYKHPNVEKVLREAGASE